MPIRENDCYGNQRKDDIVSRYYLMPLANIKMLPYMSKLGCCGQLTEQFFIFSYTSISDKSDKGTFYVGRDCALQLVERINKIKKNAGKPPLEMPQMFDISTNGGFVGGYKGKIKTLNFDVLVLLLLLAATWDTQKFYGAPANILERIVRNPLRTIGRYDLLKINDLVAKIDLFNAIRLNERDGHIIGKFTIPYFNTVLDFIETEEERTKAKAGGKQQ